MSERNRSESGGDLALLLRAAQFAAAKHRGQKRKDVDESPYINHPIEVAFILANVGGITDPSVLMAAVLHDTIEDTGTTPDELEREFGARVRGLVEELSDDKSLPKAERKRLQIEHAPQASADAKCIKLADKISNVREVIHSPPTEWTMDRRREYLRWAGRVVAGCRGVSEELERHYDALADEGRRALGSGL